MIYHLPSLQYYRYPRRSESIQESVFHSTDDLLGSTVVVVPISRNQWKFVDLQKQQQQQQF